MKNQHQFLSVFKSLYALETSLQNILTSESATLFITNLNPKVPNLELTYCLIVENGKIEFITYEQLNKTQFIFDMDSVTVIKNNQKKELSDVKELLGKVEKVVEDVKNDQAFAYHYEQDQGGGR